MRKRTNINLEDEDQAAIALIRRKYGVTSDTAAIRFALRKILREEGQPYVPGETGKHWQDRPTR
jgi:Arc/MetJ family transcription regulator